MPFYYDVNVATTTNGTAATENDEIRALTVANQSIARLMALYGASRFGTAGGALLRVKTFGTASTVGSGKTPGKRNPNAPAASTTFFTGPTAGATPVVRMSVGVAQAGGMGGWMALEPDHALALLPNGGANGNADVFSIANATSVTLDFTLEIAE